MKIKTKELSYDEVCKIAPPKHMKPKRPGRLFRWLMQTLSAGELKKVNFTYQEYGMENLKKDEPCLILMNHSSFIDLKIAATIFKDRPFNIVCTSDGFVGKKWLMQKVGCIPTYKFITDVALVKDMNYAVKKLHNSILMYPEASYSFDGTATPLPESIGKCIKLLKVPVVVVQTKGAFQRDPLYNNLQLRKVEVSAEVHYVLSQEEIEKKQASEINEAIQKFFAFDNFRWQEEKKIRISENFRADYLNRVLYKCPACKAEGKMQGKGIHLTCGECKKSYELTEFGKMKALTGETEIAHIPDWYAWERQCVKKELEEGSYHMEADVDIYMLVDMECLYKVGTGHLSHGKNGFHLVGCDGKIDYHHDPRSSYSLYADYYWYELGDMICIGTPKALYYCFPKNCGDIVAKTRLATEELYKCS